MKRKVLLGAVLALALALSCGILTACGGSSSSSSSSAARSSSASSTAQASYAPIAVSYLNKAGYEDIIVADNQGFYKDCGPEVSLYAVTGSGQQSVEALLAGSSDIAATGQGPVADAIKQYGDKIVVLAGTNITTGDQVWVAGAGMTGNAQLVAYDKSKDNKAEVKASFEAAAAAKGGKIKAGVQQGATTESAFKSWLTAMDISFNDFGAEGEGIVRRRITRGLN